MLKKDTFLLIVLLSIALALPVSATHIMGGNIEFQAIGNSSGHYKIILKTYIDLTGVTDAESDQFVWLRKTKDDSQLQSFNTKLMWTKQVVYENETCTEKRQLKTLFAYYETEIYLDPDKYTDPEGYYLFWNNCCRNGAIVNLKDPVLSTMYLKTYFPPLIKSGKPFRDSSPSFKEVEGAYICVGDPFHFPFDATDVDGDQLTYELQSPSGYNSQQNSGTQWNQGYSADNAIPGNPALNINRNTGELFVVPKQLGLFVFSVIVKETRNGEVIGSVTRDYQLYVVDCPPVSPPNPTIYYENKPANAISVCKGKKILLSASENSNWNYQWKKDGINISGATSPQLQVDQSGVYQLYTSLISTCSKSGKSQTVQIDLTETNFRLTKSGPPLICATSGKMALTALKKNSDLSFQWFKDGKGINNPEDSLVVTSQGSFYAIVINKNGCISVSDTVHVDIAPPPPAVIYSENNSTTLCTGDSLRLQPSKEKGLAYSWIYNGQQLNETANFLYVKVAGAYSSKITDSLGCTAVSNVMDIYVSDNVTVLMDPLEPLCGSDHNAVTLTGYPLGGTFQGPGVQGDLFDPKKAGIGIHQITYVVKGQGSCKDASASQHVNVRPLPVADAGKDIFSQQGEQIQLGTVGKSDLNYAWSPQYGLDDPFNPNPILTAENDITYILEVMDSNGCAAQDNVRVTIFNDVWIPDVFSPNGDGINDVWELKGIQFYPEAEISIFNRWGEVIFYSKGYKKSFDGTIKGNMQQPGYYVYKIKLDSQRKVKIGSLLLLR